MNGVLDIDEDINSQKKHCLSKFLETNAFIDVSPASKSHFAFQKFIKNEYGANSPWYKQIYRGKLCNIDELLLIFGFRKTLEKFSYHKFCRCLFNLGLRPGDSGGPTCIYLLIDRAGKPDHDSNCYAKTLAYLARTKVFSTADNLDSDHLAEMLMRKEPRDFTWVCYNPLSPADPESKYQFLSSMASAVQTWPSYQKSTQKNGGRSFLHELFIPPPTVLKPGFLPKLLTRRKAKVENSLVISSQNASKD